MPGWGCGRPFCTGDEPNEPGDGNHIGEGWGRRRWPEADHISRGWGTRAVKTATAATHVRGWGMAAAVTPVATAVTPAAPAVTPTAPAAPALGATGWAGQPAAAAPAPAATGQSPATPISAATGTAWASPTENPPSSCQLSMADMKEEALSDIESRGLPLPSELPPAMATAGASSLTSGAPAPLAETARLARRRSRSAAVQAPT